MKNELDSEKIKILVCCHKPCELPKDDIFLPIQVGAAISDVELGMQRDDQVDGEICDNISAKNKSYCELTAMYWAWKNIKKCYPDLEYIGLNHYRRYFSFDKKNIFNDYIIKSEASIKNEKINKNRLKKILNKYNAIVSREQLYPYNLEIQYSIGHVSEDIHKLKTIVHNLYPAYDRSLFDYLVCNNKISLYNMFIMRWSDFDAYCTWLFSILFECEKNINIQNYSPTQMRIWGYLGERLFNVWFLHNKLRVKKLNIYKYDNNEKNLCKLTLIRVFITKKIIWFISKSKRKNRTFAKYKKNYF